MVLILSCTDFFAPLKTPRNCFLRMEKTLLNAGVVDGELITDTVLTLSISHGPLARSLELNPK